MSTIPNLGEFSVAFNDKGKVQHSVKESAGPAEGKAELAWIAFSDKETPAQAARRAERLAREFAARNPACL